MQDISIINGAGNPQTIKGPVEGRNPAEFSQGFVLSNEDYAALTALATLLGAPNSAPAADESVSAGLNALLKALLRDFQARMPELGAQTVANSQSITFASNHPPLAVEGVVTATFDGDAPLSNTELRATPLTVLDGTSPLSWIDMSGASTGSAITLHAADANRRAFLFQNCSDVNFTLSWWGAAGASAGLLIPPNTPPLIFVGFGCPRGELSIHCGLASKRYVALRV